MTDRELLEMAAKAAGFVLPVQDEHDEIGRQYDYHLGLWVKFPWGFEWFRPHIDDSQALRLAVQITRDFEPYKSQGFGWIIGKTNEEVRRAIVRAAAEIGKETK